MITDRYDTIDNNQINNMDLLDNNQINDMDLHYVLTINSLHKTFNLKDDFVKSKSEIVSIINSNKTTDFFVLSFDSLYSTFIQANMTKNNITVETYINSRKETTSCYKMEAVFSLIFDFILLIKSEYDSKTLIEIKCIEGGRQSDHSWCVKSIISFNENREKKIIQPYYRWIKKNNTIHFFVEKNTIIISFSSAELIRYQIQSNTFIDSILQNNFKAVDYSNTDYIFDEQSNIDENILETWIYNNIKVYSNNDEGYWYSSHKNLSDYIDNLNQVKCISLKDFQKKK